MIRNLLLIVVVLLTSGCSGGLFRPRHQSSAQSLTKTPEGTEALNFALIKENVLRPACISCHTGRHQVFENYAIVRASLEQILDRIQRTGPGQMPPNQPLSTRQIQQLQDWAQLGAPEFSQTPAPVPPPSLGDLIDFAKVRESLLKPHCLGCHPHFNSYQSFQRVAVSALALVKLGQMPFPRKKGESPQILPSETIEVLQTWVEMGAPENKDGSTSQPEALEATWLSLRNQLFGPRCILCHNSFGPRAPTSMGTYQELLQWSLKSPALFNFTDPEQSHFIGALRGRVDDDEFFFDPMPFNSDFDDVLSDLEPLNESEIELIKRWIQAGLPFGGEE